MSRVSRTSSRTAQGSFNPVAMLAASAAMFLACMDILITNIALPAISAELGGGMTAQQWVVDGYTLPFATLLLLAGNLSDRLGARRVFALGTAAFAASSLVCALAGSIAVLVAGRALLGVAAALILPSSMTVINEAYPREADRRRALAIWGVGGSAATAAGPLLGGLLVPIHWSLVFSINIPICVVILMLCLRLGPSRRTRAPFDAIGQALAIVGLGCLVGGIIEGGSEGFGSPLVVGMLVAGVLGCIAFVVSQAHVQHPMMPLSLFRSPGMRVALLGGFSMILNWNGLIFLCTLFLQQELGLAPLTAGLAFVPSAIIAIGGNLASDRLSGARGVRFTIFVGIASMVCGYALLAICSGTGALDVVSVATGVCFAGVGGSITTPCLANLVLRCAAPEQSGIASAVFNTMRQVGGAIGIAVFGVLVTALPTFGAGLAASFAISLALLALMIVCTIRLKASRA